MCHKLLGHVILQGQKEISVKKLKKKKKSSGLIRILEAFNVHSFPESKDLKRKKKLLLLSFQRFQPNNVIWLLSDVMRTTQHKNKSCITVREYLRRFRQTSSFVFFFEPPGSVAWRMGSGQFLPQELLSLPSLQISAKGMTNLHWSLSSPMRSKNEPCTSRLEIWTLHRLQWNEPRNRARKGNQKLKSECFRCD